MDNEKGYAEAYKDVIHEDAIQVSGVTKAPDYCFRIGGTRKFFVEAKKPWINLKEDVSPAFQLRRYAWSAKLPLSILTDFEEFAAYDCRVKPIKSDKPSAARVLYLSFAEYTQRWTEIEGVFSREAVLKGSFDKYAETGKGKKGTAEVDAAFLREIEFWRDLLARNLALRNPSLSQRELNFAVQRIIDRVIFLRICEDRSIEQYGRLLALLNGGQVYGRYALNITGRRWVKYGPWLAAPRDPNNFLGKRILVQEITGGKERRIVATFYDGELYHSRDIIPIKIEKERPHPLYVLGIVNSRLITWFHHKRNPKAQKGLFPKILVSDLENIPICPINFSDAADNSRHDRMIHLVEDMLELNTRLAAAKTDS